MRRLSGVLLLLLSFLGVSFGQAGKKTGIIKGKIINSTTKGPYSGVRITVVDLDAFTSTEGEGDFMLSEIPYGSHKIVIGGGNTKRDTLNVNVDKEINDLGELQATPNDITASYENTQIPTIAISENSNSSTSDEGTTTDNGGGLVVSSRDPFVNAATFVFGPYRFQPRGYKRNAQELLINGIVVNDVESGNASWSTMGGLNDVFHGRTVKYGLAPSEYAFGGINGSTYLDATADNQREETKVTYSIGSGRIKNRVMVTKNSGTSKKGWAYSVSLSKRWSQEGYVPGTYFDGYAYFAAVTKTLGKGKINLSTFASPTTEGQSVYATREALDLAGTHYYNDAWGNQNGDKRSGRTRKSFLPISILNYEYRPDDKTRWNTAVSYEFGKLKVGRIDYYNVPSPWGSYYRNLPGLYYNYNPPDSTTGNLVRQQIENNRDLLQVKWADLYAANRNNIQTMNNVNGVAGDSYTGKQSEYVLFDKVSAFKKFNFSTNIERSVNEHKTFYGGFTFVSQRTEFYKEIVDLLGGDYYTNYNQFASQQYVGNPNYYQNDLNRPNAVIKKGDKYGYDYTIRFNNANLWGQLVYNFDKFDFFGSLSLQDNSFRREGFMRNGLFANNSYGLTSAQGFYNYAVKAGATYKINPRSALYVNALISTTPPTADNCFISAETRDFMVSDPSNQRNMSVEAGYMLKTSKFTAKAVGYWTEIQNATEIKRYYNDDPAYYTFVNYVMQNINTRMLGTELVVEYKVNRALTVTAASAIGQAFYTNRPTINIYQDNDTLQHAKQNKAYIKNYYLGVGPQTVGTLGFNYRPKNGMFVNVNFNYFDRDYVSINPGKRVSEAADLVPVNSPEWHKIFDQEKLPAAFIVDLRLGKTFQLSRMSKMVSKVSHNSTLTITGGINNLLNNTNYIASGYEQLRYDFTNINPNKFGNYYIYGYGMNFIVNIVLKF